MGAFFIPRWSREVTSAHVWTDPMKTAHMFTNRTESGAVSGATHGRANGAVRARCAAAREEREA
jgi:hypothetical protein